MYLGLSTCLLPLGLVFRTPDVSLAASTIFFAFRYSSIPMSHPGQSMRIYLPRYESYIHLFLLLL